MHEAVVAGLLYPCWRGVDDGYKMKYARSIWRQFEDNIRSAAYTSSLAKFYDTLARRLGIELRKEDVATVQEFLRQRTERETLKLLRDETTLLVLMVRVANDERKENLKAERGGA